MVKVNFFIENSIIWQCRSVYQHIIFCNLSFYLLVTLTYRDYQTVQLYWDQDDCTVAHATKNSASKNHLKRHFMWQKLVALINLTLNAEFKAKKLFQTAGYWILKKSPNSKFFVILPHCLASLPDHIRKHRCQTKHHTAVIY